MTGTMRARLLSPAALLALWLALALPSLALAAATPTYTKESQQAYQKQLAAGQIASATFNKRLRSLRLTLKSGEHVLYRYPKHQSKALQSALEAKHVPVTILKPAEAAKEVKPAKHKLRYIAGGVVILGIVIVGAVLLVNRRRAAREE
jgi:hypothetical protein